MAEIAPIRTPAEADATVEAIVLSLLLAEQPAQLTVAELQLELAGDPASFPRRDEVERAVRELAAVGLVHRNGELLLPSRAARRFDQLLG
jgi:predicted transcriptional regulator